MTTFDMSESIQARSDQQNYDDYIGGVVKTVTISEVRGGSAEQPVELHLVEFPGKAYKPSKSMRRVLVFAWGSDGSAYVGRRLSLYGDPDVRFGGKTVGGIKIGAMSHVDKPFTIALTETRGTKKPHKVEPLKDGPPSTPAAAPDGDSLATLFDKAGLAKSPSPDRLTVTRKVVGRADIATPADLTADEMTKLRSQLSEWDKAGKLTDEVGDILDQAAIDAAQEAEVQK